MAGADQRPEVEPIILSPYQELCGRFEGIDRTEGSIWIHLSSGSLRYAVGSPAARACQRALADSEGERVGIIRTLSPDEPIRVRHIPSERDS